MTRYRSPLRQAEPVARPFPESRQISTVFPDLMPRPRASDVAPSEVTSSIVPTAAGHIHPVQLPLTALDNRCRRIDCTAGLLVLPLQWLQPDPSVWSRGGQCSRRQCPAVCPPILDDPVVQEASVAVLYEVLRSRPSEHQRRRPGHVPVMLAERSPTWRRVLVAAARWMCEEERKCQRSHTLMDTKPSRSPRLFEVSYPVARSCASQV